MRVFTSARERSLWLAAVASVATIYSTLGAARAGVELLRQLNLLQTSVTFVLVAVAIALAVRLARRRPGRWELAAALGVGVVYTLVLLRTERAEERLHVLEYGVVGALIYLALEERRRNAARTSRSPWLVAVLATATLGWIDEGIQAILPSRVYDLRDVALNALAGGLAVGTVVLLDRARRRDLAA